MSAAGPTSGGGSSHPITSTHPTQSGQIGPHTVTQGSESLDLQIPISSLREVPFSHKFSVAWEESGLWGVIVLVCAAVAEFFGWVEPQGLESPLEAREHPIEERPHVPETSGDQALNSSIALLQLAQNNVPATDSTVRKHVKNLFGRVEKDLQAEASKLKTPQQQADFLDRVEKRRADLEQIDTPYTDHEKGVRLQILQQLRDQVADALLGSNQTWEEGFKKVTKESEIITFHGQIEAKKEQLSAMEMSGGAKAIRDGKIGSLKEWENKIYEQASHAATQAEHHLKQTVSKEAKEALQNLDRLSKEVDKAEQNENESAERMQKAKQELSALQREKEEIPKSLEQLQSELEKKRQTLIDTRLTNWNEEHETLLAQIQPLEEESQRMHHLEQIEGGKVTEVKSSFLWGDTIEVRKLTAAEKRELSQLRSDMQREARIQEQKEVIDERRKEVMQAIADLDEKSVTGLFQPKIEALQKRFDDLAQAIREKEENYNKQTATWNQAKGRSQASKNKLRGARIQLANQRADLEQPLKEYFKKALFHVIMEAYQQTPEPKSGLFSFAQTFVSANKASLVRQFEQNLTQMGIHPTNIEKFIDSSPFYS